MALVKKFGTFVNDVSEGMSNNWGVYADGFGRDDQKWGVYAVVLPQTVVIESVPTKKINLYCKSL